MLENIQNFFRGEEDHEASFIRLTRNILIFVIAINIAGLPLVTGLAGASTRDFVAVAVLSVMLILEGLSFFYVLRGRVLLAKLVIPIGLILSISAIAYNSNGLRDTSFLAMPVILVISAILLGKRSLTISTPLAVISAVVIAVRDITSSFDPRPIGLDSAIFAPLVLITSAGITHLLISRLNESTLRAKSIEQAQRKENTELTALRLELESKVQERTVDLEKAYQETEKRARQFQTVAKVMNIISSVQSLDALLPLITQVISEQFNIYHTGMFLLDAKKENAVLRAANSEGGQKMLARRHSLPVGQTGIVGFATATGQARIALDVGEDSVYFNNPDLPNTRSEIALPLIYAGQIIGALDVQSTEPNAFQQDDANVLTTLANQVAVAINNALTIENAQKTLAEANSAIGQVTQEAWQVLRPAKLGLGFTYSEAGITPLDQPIDNEQVRQVIAKGDAVLEKGEDQHSQLAVPIRLRGKVIGVMQLKTRGDLNFTNDDADIASAVAERLSLAIETATLLQSTQHRADLERVTANITTRVSSSSRFETILQTAAQELSKALGGSDVLVQIEPAALQMYK